jgi:type I restriction enzyme, S subunit
MPSYKQTDVGLIPEDWYVRSIAESMRLVNGRAFKPSDWVTRGLPIIRIQNLNDPKATFNYFFGPVEEKYIIEAGDLLFAWSGTTGTSFGARVWHGPTGILNQHIFKVLPDKKKLSTDYALLVLLQVQEKIEKQAHGFKASFVHVKKSDLVGIGLPLPPTKTEQDAIACSPRSATSNGAPCKNCFPARRACQALRGSGCSGRSLTWQHTKRNFSMMVTGSKQSI